ncbi:MAG: prepilin-type N-terminal cleavage/methylation domain-containing protein [Methylacidiphilales bacterium]|nr:prepilin-type N-terminal cleavage/methylation domain-containing protein [Candidatus Methylacidiphilales bacterium]MDW8349574.1 prepilin-type N-terminal cleavage/methylation domain-containing protein [Verrucomicrobiae bacterium]
MVSCVYKSHFVRARRAFSLTELLVVVAIVAVLASLVVTGVPLALNRARMSKAQTDVASISTAWRHYFAEYNSWPMSNTSVVGDGLPREMGQEACNILTGLDLADNPRALPFIEISLKDRENKAPGVPPNSRGRFMDPWKRPYYYALDHDLNDRVVVFGIEIPAPVAAWSRGPKNQDPIPENATRTVRSW